MKKLNLFLSVFMVLFIASCASKEPSVLEKKITQYISFQGTDKRIVKDFNYKNNVNDLVEFELVLQSEKELELEYKISWLDEDGFRLSSLNDEKFIAIKLKANQEFILQRVAANKEATNFKITIVKK
ncbi:hypothetical protein DMB92_06090 [Campylobacter sp. MIT 99-7217]|uniref:DUF1425 domain-containing protein n=1 Tax=Campylobacter sp. MIT 99-7217 TaxID=535091 RepID=UPI00115B839E|nr:DUF1425 domain-containing protein [Campylobacter sp. MIT 99-7217]TQR31260.1 hypothetical protein DMB92_06090 [Campylobacter sp. MIT 99-7217]